MTALKIDGLYPILLWATSRCIWSTWSILRLALWPSDMRPTSLEATNSATLMKANAPLGFEIEFPSLAEDHGGWMRLINRITSCKTSNVSHPPLTHANYSAVLKAHAGHSIDSSKRFCSHTSTLSSSSEFASAGASHSAGGVGTWSTPHSIASPSYVDSQPRIVAICAFCVLIMSRNKYGISASSSS